MNVFQGTWLSCWTIYNSKMEDKKKKKKKQVNRHILGWPWRWRSESSEEESSTMQARTHGKRTQTV